MQKDCYVYPSRIGQILRHTYGVVPSALGVSSKQASCRRGRITSQAVNVVLKEMGYQEKCSSTRGPLWIPTEKATGLYVESCASLLWNVHSMPLLIKEYLDENKVVY